jgi:hypothetical protein
LSNQPCFTDKIAILGCGAHASVVFDACQACGFTVLSFLVEKGFSDSASALAGNVVEMDYESPLGIDAVGTPLIALAIGDNHARLR